MTADRSAPGGEFPARTYRITRSDLAEYAAASGDDNPIHLDAGAAADAGLPGVVAHGMLVMALAGRAVRDWTGRSDALVSFDLRFTRYVVVSDEDGAGLTVSGRRSDAGADSADALAKIAVTVRDDARAVVARASAVVRM